MPLYELSTTTIRPLERASFAALQIRERDDLQRILRDHIEVISPDTLVVAEEFGEWEDAKRRIDLLGIDRQANLVVIELKRTEEGGHMELQALRYAAMVATLTFERLVEIHQRFLVRLGRPEEDARKRLLAFLEAESEDELEFAEDVRIVLASADFSKEITTTVMWLNERELDIRCMRLQPYLLEGRTVLDVQQIIPLPEAQDLQVRLREKQAERRQARRSGDGPDRTRYDLRVAGESYVNLPKNRMLFQVVRAAFAAGIPQSELPLEPRSWLVVEGRCQTQEEFKERLEEQQNARAKELDRWFSETDQLLRSPTHTYCLSRQFGPSAIPRVEQIQSKYPGLRIEFAEHREHGL